MKVIDINTKELIEELGDFPGVYWTTPEYWAAYKAVCEEMDKGLNKIWYGG